MLNHENNFKTQQGFVNRTIRILKPN